MDMAAVSFKALMTVLVICGCTSVYSQQDCRTETFQVQPNFNESMVSKNGYPTSFIAISLSDMRLEKLSHFTWKFVQILFPLRGERISNLIDFSREFFSIAGWEKKICTNISPQFDILAQTGHLTLYLLRCI